MRMKTIKWLVASVSVIACTWVAWDNWGRFAFTDAGLAATEVALTEDDKAQQQARGQYLATVGGCVSCHTVRGQALMSGGRVIPTPYGTAVSSNLSASKQHGIGAWSLHDFEMALRWGRSADGRLLLPVFPYNHTSLLQREDAQAIYAWLQSLPPVEQAVPSHQLTWPLGTQPVIAVWRTLFFKPQTWQADVHQSDAFNRGAYLVQGLGHCAACHGQRNALGSFPAVADLSGGVLMPQAWVAPSLVDAKQTAMARSSTQEVAELLRSGQNAHATVSGPMGEFVQQNSQYLTPADALAMATYLKQSMKPVDDGVSKGAVPELYLGASPEAPRLYKTHCASCHGEQGQGKDKLYPALAGNPAVQLERPDNLIQMALYGGYGPSTALRPRPYGMPPFVLALTNQEIADVITYVRQSWGNQAGAVSPMQVDKVRAAKY
jgi:mono/diheme cytochrome c family protein